MAQTCGRPGHIHKRALKLQTDIDLCPLPALRSLLLLWQVFITPVAAHPPCAIHNWRALAFACSLIALVATAGVVWISARSRIVPFVVVTDNLGRPVASGLADQASSADEQFKRFVLIEWLEDLRLVTTDGITQRKAIDRVYSHIATGSPAQTLISDFYRNNQPFVRAQAETVSVDVQSVLQNSEQTLEIEWVETIRDLYGAVKEKDRWKGSFSIAINPPKDERLARINPFGIYVTQAAWSRVL